MFIEDRFATHLRQRRGNVISPNRGFYGTPAPMPTGHSCATEAAGVFGTVEAWLGVQRDGPIGRPFATAD
jgi:hypothetical protein